MVNVALHTDADPTRRRLNRGHRQLGHRRWGDPIQRQVDVACNIETPCHDVAQDRAVWAEMEAGFVARVLRRVHTEPLPRHRCVLQEN